MSSLDDNKDLDKSVPVINEAEVTETKVVKTIDYSILSRAELVEALRQLLESKVELIRDEVELIKVQFYKKLKQEMDELRSSHTEHNGDATEFKPEKDTLEDTFKDLLNDFKALKAARHAAQEQERISNVLQKKQILEQMKAMIESTDDVSTYVVEFKALLGKWKSIGQVPATEHASIIKTFSNYQEKFWDLIKMNNEFREYDFKKNLEAKVLLCEAAERLDLVVDVVSAFQQLQKLHAEWHEIGAVAREHREDIWMRFKTASTVINKKHQFFFEGVRNLEEEFQQKKTDLCKKIETIDLQQLTTYKAWEDATQMILSIQAEWRTLGFAPRKVNQQLFERYRTSCDAFFAAKNIFFKKSKNTLSDNLEKKMALCQKAESLKDSTSWKETTDLLIQLQKEWKQAGPVSKKMSDELWKRFVSACDYFFEQKKLNTTSFKDVENSNYTKKKELIEKIKALKVEKSASEALVVLRTLIAEWNSIGHVPFKEKDKIYKEFREVVDKQFDLLNVNSTQRKLDNFKSNIKDISTKGENKLYREREKLVKAYEQLKAEIATYENNIGFFSSNSKKGGSLIKDMERKIEALKEESKLIEEKVRLIDEQI